MENKEKTVIFTLKKLGDRRYNITTTNSAYKRFCVYGTNVPFYRMETITTELNECGIAVLFEVES